MSIFLHSSKLKSLLWGLVLILFFAFCNNKKEQLEPDGESQPLVFTPKAGTPEEIARMVGDTALIDHRDLKWELIKNNQEESAIAASSYISRCSAGNPYNNVANGQTAPGQGNSDACQSFAAAMAHNEYRYRKWGGTCVNVNPLNWQRSPWHIFYNSYYNFSGLIWTASTPLNALYYYGATHLTCMPGWIRGNPNPYPGQYLYYSDPQFGIYSTQDIFNKALNGRISDKSWAWVNNGNFSAVPISGCAQLLIDQAQIRNALNNGRVVLLRFALVNGALPVVNNYPGVAGPVFHTNNTCGKDITRYHIVALLGYDDATRVYRVQNSWGVTNGMDGMGGFWMSYDAVSARADQAAYINY